MAPATRPVHRIIPVRKGINCMTQLMRREDHGRSRRLGLIFHQPLLHEAHLHSPEHPHSVHAVRMSPDLRVRAVHMFPCLRVRDARAACCARAFLHVRAGCARVSLYERACFFHASSVRAHDVRMFS